MVTAFAGHLSSEEVLLLWDRIVGFNSLQILPGTLFYTINVPHSPMFVCVCVCVCMYVCVDVVSLVFAVSIFQFRASNLLQAISRVDVEVCCHLMHTYVHPHYTPPTLTRSPPFLTMPSLALLPPSQCLTSPSPTITPLVEVGMAPLKFSEGVGGGGRDPSLRLGLFDVTHLHQMILLLCLVPRPSWRISDA